MAAFVDALILQDNDAKYLNALRAKAERDHRPLFVQPNGKACCKNYVTRVWSETFEFGAHATRTLVHDFFGSQGEAGLMKALMLCDQYGRETAKHYRTASLAQRLMEGAQDEVDAACLELDE